MMKAEYSAMLRYKGQAITLAQRIGLHQSQKRFNFGALTVETRKKVFWTIYTLDWYAAAF
jgi:Fungal specific transcription factor domain